MKKVLIATHGKMASGMSRTIQHLVGNMAEITTIDAYVEPDDDIETQMSQFFEQAGEEKIFVFTDIQGGSVNQKLLKYSERKNVVLITGVNIPILIQIMFADDDVTVDELQKMIEEARQELKLVSADGCLVEENKLKKSTQEKKQVVKQPENYENSTAKIAALRIDDRLIHGQVAMTWTKQLKVQGIVVANDEAANDPTQKMALKMAVPAGIKVLIKPVQEAIRMLNHPKAEKMRILVLTRTVKDAVTVRENVGEIGFLNLGNTGRFDGIEASKKQSLSPTIMLTKEEIQSLKKLVELDDKVCMQQVPNDEQKLVKDVLGKLDE